MRIRFGVVFLVGFFTLFITAAIVWKPEVLASGNVQHLKNARLPGSTQIMSSVPISMGRKTRMLSFVTRIEADGAALSAVEDLRPRLIDAWVTALNALPPDMIHTRFRAEDARRLEDILARETRAIVGPGVKAIHFEKTMLF